MLRNRESDRHSIANLEKTDGRGPVNRKRDRLQGGKPGMTGKSAVDESNTPLQATGYQACNAAEQRGI
jgi:hypothetical protein